MSEPKPSEGAGSPAQLLLTLVCKQAQVANRFSRQLLVPAFEEAVPQVIGLGAGTVIVADELNGRLKVKAVDWSNGRVTPLAIMPFLDESFSFAPGTQAVLPR